MQFNNPLDEIMPEINIILTRITGNSSKILYDFVEKYEYFDNIKRNGEQKFIKEYSAWAKKKGYRNGAIKALKIYELYQNSITARLLFTYIAFKNCIKILRETEESRNSILIQMQTITYTLPEYKIVM